jgi:arginyl-tRNA synthetase
MLIHAPFANQRLIKPVSVVCSEHCDDPVSRLNPIQLLKHGLERQLPNALSPIEYCVNIFPIVKLAGKAPNIISEEVANELSKNADIFRSTSATGGYVNFFLTDSVWIEMFADLCEKQEIKSLSTEE